MNLSGVNFYGAEELNFSAYCDRPRVILNMVASVDGKTTTCEGKLAGLSSPVDRQVMRRIRSQVDAILVGGNTLRHDRFVASVSTGRQPLAVVLTRSADLPSEHPFWQAEQERVILVTAGAEIPGWLRQRAVVRVFSGSLPEAIDILFQEFKVGVLLSEGGASLNYHLISQGFGDELFFTIAPVLVGGKDNFSVLGGEGFGMGDRPQSLELVSVYPVGNELYLRYRFRR